MAFIKTANRYSAFMYPNTKDVKARINLYCTGNHKLYIDFYEESATLPDNTYDDTYLIGRARVPISYYPNYIDLIRNEGPIRVTFRPEDSPPRFVVYAGSEEPGEGED